MDNYEQPQTTLAQVANYLQRKKESRLDLASESISLVIGELEISRNPGAGDLIRELIAIKMNLDEANKMYKGLETKNVL
jgi:hypothetical protein